jgi:hypothetical protein
MGERGITMPPHSDREVSKDLEEEAKIERMLKKNPNRIMARYFHRIDTLNEDVEDLNEKFDAHLKAHGKQWNGLLGKIMPHVRDIVLVCVLCVTTILTGKVMLYP